VVTTDIDGDSSTPVVDLFTPPLMEWGRVTNATHYRVFASIANANSYSPMNVSTNWPAFVYTGLNSTLGTLLDGSYDFYVEAYSSTNTVLGDSGVSTFQVDYNPVPKLLSPTKCLSASTCTSVNDTPTLDWNSVPFAGSYLVYLANDPNFTNITRTWSTIYSQLTPLESLPDSQAGQATYWFIRPCFTPTACAPFDLSVYPRAFAFRKTSEPIQAMTPAATTPVTVVTNEVTFTWKDYLSTENALLPTGSVTQSGGESSPFRVRGVAFDCLKFRTMYEDAEHRQDELEGLNEKTGALFKIRDDPRVTPFGRFLRRYSIDEVPQLINVLRGEMSLVGPRPLPLRDDELLSDWHRRRYLVLPGITGLWQVSGRSDLDFDDMVRLDFLYLERWSVLLDLVILLKTVPAVLRRKGAY